MQALIKAVRTGDKINNRPKTKSISGIAFRYLNEQMAPSMDRVRLQNLVRFTREMN